MASFLRSERGQALAMALAFMMLALPIVTGALTTVSIAALDSRSKTEALDSQYRSLGAREMILYDLSTSSTLSDGATSTLFLNGGIVTTSILRLLTPPTNLPFTTLNGAKFS